MQKRIDEASESLRRAHLEVQRAQNAHASEDVINQVRDQVLADVHVRWKERETQYISEINRRHVELQQAQAKVTTSTIELDTTACGKNNPEKSSTMFRP